MLRSVMCTITLGSLFTMSATAHLALASPPVISTLEPIGGRPGSEVQITLTGKDINAVEQLWTSFPAEATLGPHPKSSESDKEPSADQKRFRLTIPLGTPVGIYGLRASGGNGISPIRLFAVDDLPTVAQQARSASQSTAQMLDHPVAVDGVVSPLGRNYFQIHAKQNQRLSIEVLARRLGSKLDPMMRILDGQGREIVYSDDVPGLRSDCRLCWTFEKEDDYVIEVRDIEYEGGPDYFFRLRIGDFPCVTVPFPMAVRRGSRQTVSFSGTETDEVAPVKLAVPDDYSKDWFAIAAKRINGMSSAFSLIAVNDFEQMIENEANNSLADANHVQPETSFHGRIDSDGDVDYVKFAAKKGNKVRIRGVTRRQGSPASLNLRLLDTNGKQLASVQDFGVSDPILNFNPPKDSEYFLEISDLHHRGGQDHAYFVTVEDINAGFALTALNDTLNVPRRGTTMVTVNAQRNGYSGPITIEAKSLPDGVHAHPTIIGPGQTSAVLTLSANESASSETAYPVAVTGSAKIGNETVVVAASFAQALKNVLDGLPWPPEPLTAAAIASVAPEPEFTLKARESKITFGPLLTKTVQVDVQRNDGVEGEITIAASGDGNGLPAGVTIDAKPIPKDKTQTSVTFTATDKAKLGEFTAVLTGTLKKDKDSITYPSPGVVLQLQQALKISVRNTNNRVRRGEELALAIKVTRNDAFEGPVELRFEKLPDGVVAAPVTLAAQQSEVELILQAAQDAAQGEKKGIVVKAQAKSGKQTLNASSPPLTLVIE